MEWSSRVLLLSKRTEIPKIDDHDEVRSTKNDEYCNPYIFSNKLYKKYSYRPTCPFNRA